MKNIPKWPLILIILAFIGWIKSEYDQKEISTKNQSIREAVNVLQSDQNGMGTYNIHFLVINPDSLNSVLAHEIANLYCGEKCNQLYFWKSKKAYDLLMYKRSHFLEMSKNTSMKEVMRKEEQWKKKNDNWITISENLIATYSGFDDDYYTYPYAREIQYRELGGKMRFSD